jgi:hypothetical protein
MSEGDWYWCLDHRAAEPAGTTCSPSRRLGPYPSRDAAEHWKDRMEARNEQWDAEDRAWDDQR